MLHLERFIILSIWFSFAGFYNLSAQDCTLRLNGIVKDIHHSDEGLEYATIFIQEMNKGVVCDEAGHFEMEQICAGKYHILVSHMGCQSQTIFFEINKDTTIQILLEHHSALLEEVLVTDFKSDANIGLNGFTISGNTLQSLAGKDVAEIVSQIPGVNILKSGSGINKPIINGLYGNRIVILNQGIPQEGQQWGNDHAPEIDAFTTQKITVVKGSAAVRYGVNALSGIVLLESLPIKTDPHIHGHFLSSYATNGRGWINNLTFEQTTKLFKYRAIISAKKSGDKSASDYYLTNTGNREYNAAFLFTNSDIDKWSRKLYFSTFNSEQGILRGSHIGNLTDLEDALSRTIPLYTKEHFTYQIASPRQKVNHHLIKFENKIQLKAHSFFSIDISQQYNQRKEFDVRRGGRDSLPTLHLNLASFIVDAYYANSEKKVNWIIGVQHKTIKNGNGSGTGILPLIPNYALVNPGLYTILRSKIYDGFHAELGGRFEYQWLKANVQITGNNVLKRENKYGNVAGNIGFAYEGLKILSGKLNLAYTMRSPMVNELYSRGLHQSLASIEEGNENLTHEKSIKGSLEFKIKPFHDGQISLGLYHHNFNNFIYLAPSGENRITIRGAFPVFVYKQANASIRGVDVMYNQSINHHLEMAYKFSALKGINKETKKGLIYMPPLNTSAEINYITEKWFFMKDVRLGLKFSYMAKQNNVDASEDFAESPKAYNLWDLNYSFKENISRYQLLISLKVENVMNQRYRDYLNRMHYFADDIGRNIQLKAQLIF